MNNRTLLSHISKLYKEDNKTFHKSFKYLRQHNEGKKHLNLFSSITHLILAATPINKSDSENDKAIKFIGSRIFNDGIVSFRDALNGYYSQSILIQRDLIEIQFLLDYFRMDSTKIKSWREVSNAQRYNQFGPHVLYKALDKRDGFTGENRKKTYQEFCELAGHVSYPGFKLQTDEKNDVVVGGFYNEQKLLNTIIELNRRYGHTVVTLYSFIEIKNINLLELWLKVMAIYGKTYNINVYKNEEIKKIKSQLSDLKRKSKKIMLDKV